MKKRIEYRSLKPGEIIRRTDQFYGFVYSDYRELEKVWQSTGLTGERYSTQVHLPHRRRIKTRKK